MSTVNQMEIEGTLYDIEDTEARANASAVPAMETRLQAVEDKADANETAIDNLAQSVPVAQYAAGSTDIESFSISGASHALRDTAARALLVPATTAKTGLVKPDGSTITVDADGTIHGTPSSSLTPEYMAGGTDIIAFDVSGTSHAVRDAGARALLVPATTLQTGLVKPDGSTITVDLDGTIHAPAGAAIVQLTEAAYNALTPAQQQNGSIYFVQSSSFLLSDYQLIATANSTSPVAASLPSAPPAFVVIVGYSNTIKAGLVYNVANTTARLLTQAELAIFVADIGQQIATIDASRLDDGATNHPSVYWSGTDGWGQAYLDAATPTAPTVRTNWGGMMGYLYKVGSKNFIALNGIKY